MAGSVGAIRAGQAYVEIFANDSKFQQSMTRIRTTMQTVGTQLKRAGTGMFLGGGAIGAPLVIAARTAAEFSLQMARVRANTGATDSQFAALNETAKKLAVSFGRAPQEVAGALSELAKAGLDAEGVMKSISPILALAAADNLELARAVEVAVSTMAQFGMTTSDFGQIADKLQAAANESTTSVDLIGEALSYVGPKAQEAGQSFDDVAAAIATLADAGLRGSLGGTGLARVIESIANEEDKLKTLGVRTRDVNNQMRPFIDILEELGQKTANLSNSDRIRAFTDIFEIRGANAAMSLTNMRASFDENLAAIQNSTGAALGKAGAVMQSFGGQVAQLSASFGVLKVRAIEALGPMANRLVASMTNATKSIGDFISRNGELVFYLGAGSAAFVALGAAAIAAGVAIRGVANVLGMLQKALAVSALLVATPATFAAAVAAIAGVGFALRQLWPDFRRTSDEWLQMIGVMSSGPKQENKLIEPRDIAPMLSAGGQAQLRGIQEQQRSPLGGDVDVPAAMRRVVLEEVEIIKNLKGMSDATKKARVFELLQIAGRLSEQIAARKVDAAGPQAGAAAVKPRVEAAPILPTEAQMEDANRIRLENRTPQEKLADERKRLLQLLDIGALDEGNFIKAVAKAEADAMDEIAKANKEAVREFERIADRVADIRQEVATPEEKLVARIEELKSLPLDPETFARAIERAKADAVDAMLSAAREQQGKGFSSAGTFGDVANLGIGPELADPMKETAENTRRVVEELVAANAANGVPAVGAVPAAPGAPIGAEVAAPRAAEIKQAAAAGAEAAAATATLNASVQAMQAQVVAAIGKTTAAIESTVGVLQKIADNTADLGGAFL